MESWVIQLFIGGVTYVAMFVTMKNKTEQNEKNADKFERKLEVALKELAEQKLKLAKAASLQEVTAGFVPRELFKQFGKHIDERFDGVGKSLSNIEENQKRMFDKLEHLLEMKG